CSLGIGDERSQVCPLLRPDPLTRRTPAERAVERETVWRQLFEAAAALRTGPMQAEALDGPFRFGAIVVDLSDMQPAPPQIEGYFDRVGDPPAPALRDRESVDDDFDVVFAPAIELGHFIEGVSRSVDAHAAQALRTQTFPQSFVSVADDDFLR